MLDGTDVARAWILVVLVAFALNMGWEYLQLPLYGDEQRSAVDLPTWILYRAGVNDALLITATLAVGLVVRRRSTLAFWLFVVLALAAIASFIEIRAMLTDRWSYRAAMPTIGSVGLSPLLQLPLTGAATALLVRPWLAHGGD